jgi:hypothetical protein
MEAERRERLTRTASNPLWYLKKKRSAFLHFLLMWPKVIGRQWACLLPLEHISTLMGLSIAALMVAGAADNVSVVTRLTLMQLETPDDMRGRVAAVNAIFIGASNQLGEFESGTTAAMWGPVGSVVFGGLATVGVALAALKVFPDLAQRDRMVLPK